MFVLDTVKYGSVFKGSVLSTVVSLENFFDKENKRGEYNDPDSYEYYLGEVFSKVLDDLLLRTDIIPVRGTTLVKYLIISYLNDKSEDKNQYNEILKMLTKEKVNILSEESSEIDLEKALRNRVVNLKDILNVPTDKLKRYFQGNVASFLNNMCCPVSLALTNSDRNEVKFVNYLIDKISSDNLDRINSRIIMALYMAYSDSNPDNKKFVEFVITNQIAHFLTEGNIDLIADIFLVCEQEPSNVTRLVELIKADKASYLESYFSNYKNIFTGSTEAGIVENFFALEEDKYRIMTDSYYFPYYVSNGSIDFEELIGLDYQALSIKLYQVKLLAKTIDTEFSTSYGVELEMVVKEVDKIGENSFVALGWNGVGDASIQPNDKNSEVGIEYVSPILTPKNIDTISMVCEAIANLAYTNSSCGLHIHAGVTRPHEFFESKNDASLPDSLSLETIKQIVINYIYLEERGLAFPKRDYNMERLNNGVMMITGVINANTSDYLRYVVNPNGRKLAKVNLFALEAHGTIEFREHPGTNDFNNISSWLQFIDSLVSLSMEMTKDNQLCHIPNEEERKTLDGSLEELKSKNNCVIGGVGSKARAVEESREKSSGSYLE